MIPSKIRSVCAFTIICTRRVTIPTWVCFLNVTEVGVLLAQVKDTDVWFVEFYSPGCGHCQVMPWHAKADLICHLNVCFQNAFLFAAHE